MEIFDKYGSGENQAVIDQAISLFFAAQDVSGKYKTTFLSHACLIGTLQKKRNANFLKSCAVFKFKVVFIVYKPFFII